MKDSELPKFSVGQYAHLTRGLPTERLSTERLLQQLEAGETVTCYDTEGGSSIDESAAQLEFLLQTNTLPPFTEVELQRAVEALTADTLKGADALVTIDSVPGAGTFRWNPTDVSLPENSGSLFIPNINGIDTSQLFMPLMPKFQSDLGNNLAFTASGPFGTNPCYRAKITTYSAKRKLSKRRKGKRK